MNCSSEPGVIAAGAGALPGARRRYEAGTRTYGRAMRTCLALLAATALLAMAAPAQAQTEVWSATLTPVNIGGSGILGCLDVPFAQCSITAILSDDDFTHDSTDYTVFGLILETDGSFSFAVDTIITTETAALTLVVGSTSLVLADATTTNNLDRTWASSGVSLTAGTAITVKLTAAAPTNTPATGAPTITGTAQVGQTLTASTTGIADADGLTSVSYAYQWIRVNGTEADIAAANSSTYILVDADLGTTLKVRVTFADDASNSETLTSAATATVGAAATGPPTVTDVAVTSTPASGTTYYLAGEAIEFTVTFSAPVTVTATPKFAFRLGAATRQAAYASGSDSAALVFARTVQAGEVDSNGISWNALALALDGGTITQTGATTAAILTHAEQASLEGHRVDAAPPMQVSASVRGLSLVLVYDEPLDPASMPATGAYTVTATVGATTTNPAVSEVSIYGIWVTLALDAAPAAGATVTLAYAPPASNPVQDEAGNDAPAFSGQSVRLGPPPPDLEQVLGVSVTPGNAQLVVTWTAVSTATGYTVQWKSSGQGYNTGDRQATVTSGTTTSHTITGLANGTEYTVQVSATRTGANDGPPSDEMTGTPFTTPPPPPVTDLEQVLGVSVTPGNAQLVVTWTAVDNATGYTVQWKSGGQGYNTGDRQATVTTGSTTSHTITGLANGTEYTVQVSATRTGANDGPPSDEMTGTPFTTPPPPPPVTDLAQVTGVGVAPGNAQLVVTWTAVDNATGYTVQWKSSGQGYNTGDRQATVTSGSTTRYTIPSLANGTEYTVRVIATRTGADDGPPSEEETGTPRVPNTAATGAPTITGTAQVGETLTASTTGIADANGLTSPTYTYQWIRVDGTEADIAGENSSTYTLVDADLGKTLKVKVTFADDLGHTETLTSAATATVGAAATGPTVNDVAVTSTPASGNTYYLAGEVIEFTVTFSAPVTVTATPKFAFRLGAATRQAAYASGSDSAALVFARTVQAGEVDRNGISWNSLALALDGGTITQTGATTAARLTHAAQASLEGHRVDAAPPMQVSASVRGLSLVLVYDEPLDPASMPATAAYTVTATVGATTTNPAVSEVSIYGIWVTLALDAAPAAGATVTLAYAPPASNPVQDEAGNDAPAFSGQSVRLGPPPPPPDLAQVMGVTVAPGNAQLVVTWTAVDNATSYTVQWTSGSQGYNTGDRQATVTSGSTTSHTITGLANGTEYTVQVSATRTGANDGPPSDEMTGTPRVPPPPPPPPVTDLEQVLGVSVTPGNAQLVVTWTAVSTATGYTVQWKSGSQGYNTTNRQATVTSGTTTSHTITGLANGTEYTVQVSATRTGANDGPPSDEMTGTPTVPTAAGIAVSTAALTVTEQDSTGDGYTVVLDTEPTADVVVTVAGHVGTDVTANPTTLTFTMSNWETAQTVTVTADDDADTTDDSVALTHSAASADSGYSGIAIAGVAVTVNDNDTAQVMGVGVAPGNAQLVVTWTAVDNATGYTVQWKSGGQGYNSGDRQATVTSGSTTSHTITGLTNGTEYTVQVSATRTGANDGPPSDEMTGTHDAAAAAGDGPCAGDGGVGHTGQRAAGGDLDGGGHRHGLHGAVEVGRPGLQHHQPAGHGHFGYDHESHDHGPRQRHRIHGAGERDPDRRQRRPALGRDDGDADGTDRSGHRGVDGGADGDGAGLDRGRLHGGAGYRADGGCRGDGGRARGHGRDREPDHPDLHDVELGNGADGDGDRGRRCGHHGRFGRADPQRGERGQRLQRHRDRRRGGDGERQRHRAGDGGGGRPGQRAAGGDLDGSGQRHGLHGAVDVGQPGLQQRRPAGHGHVGVDHESHDHGPRQRHRIHGAGERDPDGRQRRPALGRDDGDALHHAPAPAARPCAGDGGGGRPGQRAAGGDLDGGGHRHGLHGAVDVGQPGLQQRRPAGHGHVGVDHESHDHGPRQRHRIHGAGERDPDRRQRRPALGRDDGDALHHAAAAAAAGDGP